MNPIDRTTSQSIFHHKPEEASSKILFELPENLTIKNQSSNALALAWLAHALDFDIKLLHKDGEKTLSSVYFFLIAEAIGRT